MALTLVSTPGAANANSYEEIAEADAYFEARLPLVPPWDESGTKDIQLVMATRLIDAMFRGGRVYVQKIGDKPGYYLVRRAWNGLPSTTTQRLAFPRTGLFHENGAVVEADEIPWELKEAVAEFAGQLGVGDRTLDSDVNVQGITSVRAGSVSVTFKDGYIDPRVVPDAVINLIPPSWYTEEQEIPAGPGFDFEAMP